MTPKQRAWVNFGAGLMVLAAVVAYIADHANSRKQEKTFRDYMMEKMDSTVYQSARTFNVALMAAEAANRDRDQEIIYRETIVKPKIYNNYVTTYSNLRPDSTLIPYLEIADHKFDSLMAAGFFAKP